jgi:hypothetical protein
MRPQRPLMRPQHPFGEGVARTGLLVKGLLVPVCWGTGLMRPQRPLMRPQHPLGEGLAGTGLLGEGVLVPVCWERGSDAPPASTDAPPASFGGRGPQVVGKESYKRGVSSILFISCSTIFLLIQIILQVCEGIVNITYVIFLL